MANLLKHATNSEQLKNAISDFLKGARKRGEYIVDRQRCVNFGSIFKDGYSSYSNIDLFCERLFKERAITMVKKELDVFSEEDQPTVNKYMEMLQFIQDVANNKCEASEEEVEKCKVEVEELKEKVESFVPVQKEMELPFYINPMTNEEFPVYCLRNATDEDIERWATELAAFVEAFKSVVTPLAFNPYFQPNGLEVRVIGAPKWADIMVR